MNRRTPYQIVADQLVSLQRDISQVLAALENRKDLHRWDSPTVELAEAQKSLAAALHKITSAPDPAERKRRRKDAREFWDELALRALKKEQSWPRNQPSQR